MTTVPVIRHTLNPGVTDSAGHVASWVITHTDNTDHPSNTGEVYQHCLVRWGSGYKFANKQFFFCASWRFIKGSPGRVLDWHVSSYDPSHVNNSNRWFSRTKSGAETGVAPIALDWKQGSVQEGVSGLLLTLQPEGDDFRRRYHWSVLSDSEMIAARNAQKWVVVEGELGLGRPDTDGKGYAKLWAKVYDSVPGLPRDDGSLKVDLSNVATIWTNDTVLALIQSGGYWNVGLNEQVVNDSALVKVGATREIMLADNPTAFGFSGTGTHVPNGTLSYSSTPIDPHNVGDIVLDKAGEGSDWIEFTWSAIPGANGYRLTREKANGKYSHTWDGTRTRARFSRDSAWYRVEPILIDKKGEYRV